MTTDDSQFNFNLSRRRLFTEAGIAGGAAVAVSIVGNVAAQGANTPAAPAPSTSAVPGAAPAPDPLTISPVAGLHLQFGADASSEMIASWHTLQPVRNPRVMLGTLDGKLDRIVGATAASYIDAKSGQIVYVYHAKLDRLSPDSAYLYGAHHDGV
jgi:hypothetical protein